MTQKPEPRTDFNWWVYSDATLAGLSVLIPIPLLDMLFEEFFRRRMPGDIARGRGQRISPEVTMLLNRTNDDCLTGCVLLPIRLMYELVKRLSKKLLYFLTVKDAADRVSYYWHRAFLIDYALLLGHLDDPQNTARVQCAIAVVIDISEYSPLMQVARQIVSTPGQVFRMLRRARRGEKDQELEARRKKLAENWVNFEGYLRTLAFRYDHVYETRCTPQPVPPPASQQESA